MDEEALNMSIRKFLKTVGVSSQREIEQAVAKAIAAGTLSGSETLPAAMTLPLPPRVTSELSTPWMPSTTL